jgi:pimeloyl-ACP methyl ester carboxylesterase
VACEGHDLVGDVLGDGDAVDLLLLHGAGRSCRARFREMREEFWAAGITSAAFDCIGHGDTGGALKASSLRSRTEQACRVLDTLSLAPGFSLLGASMGGYTAVTLTERYPVASLLLLGPAMYAAEAYAAPFNGGFTEIIRRPGSWEASDAWEILSRFRGRLLVVAGEQDAVIPPGVIRSIYESAKNARERTLYVAPTSHLIITDLRAKEPARLAEVMALMTRMLTAGEMPGVPGPRSDVRRPRSEVHGHKSGV